CTRSASGGRCCRCRILDESSACDDLVYDYCSRSAGYRRCSRSSTDCYSVARCRTTTTVGGVCRSVCSTRDYSAGRTSGDSHIATGSCCIDTYQCAGRARDCRCGGTSVGDCNSSCRCRRSSCGGSVSNKPRPCYGLTG